MKMNLFRLKKHIHQLQQDCVQTWTPESGGTLPPQLFSVAGNWAKVPLILEKY